MPTQHRNLFLASLSEESRDLLLEHAVAVSLPIRTLLFRAEEIPHYVHFLTSGVASVVSSMDDGEAAEVGMHGREGVVGALHVLGPTPSPTRCFMQLDGDGLKIPMADLRNAFRSSEEVRERVLEFVQKEAMILSQVAACHRLHEAEERLVRWLLTAQNKMQTDTLNFTQEFLAEMLGSRRATVTVVAGALQRAGLIEYRRGHVKVLDRVSLEAAACDCYGIIRDLRGDVYGGVSAGTAAD